MNMQCDGPAASVTGGICATGDDGGTKGEGGGERYCSVPYYKGFERCCSATIAHLPCCKDLNATTAYLTMRISPLYCVPYCKDFDSLFGVFANKIV